MQISQTRRDFLAGLSAAGAAGVLGARAALADEAPPETTTIRLSFYPNVCLAPQDIAEDLLRAEGFTDVRYIPDTAAVTPSHAANSTSTSIPPHGSSPVWMPASRSRRWRACIPGATSCSRTSRSEPSAT